MFYAVFQVYKDGATEGDTSQSGDYASPSPGFVVCGAEYASPSVREPSFRRRGASLSGEEASPNGSEVSPSVGEAVPSEGEAMKNDQAVRSGEEAVPRGEEAMPSGDNALQSGDEGEREEIWGINSLLLLQR